MKALPVRRGTALAAAALVTLGALSACSADSDSEGDATTPETTGASATTEPAESDSAGGAGQVAVTMVSGSDGDECQLDTDTVAAGPITFNVVNESAAAISEFELLSGAKIVGEKENLAPGLPEVSLTLTLGGGDYTVYCPGAVTEQIPFTVTGEASAAPTGTAAELLQQGATDYASYVTTQVDAMVTAVQRLQEAVDSGDLATAQQAYAESRPFYEKIESDVDGFVLDGFDPTDNHGNLDYLIDMRASNIDPAVGWSGFHAVERDLFKKQKITAKTKKYAADLLTNVQQLATVAGTLEFKPEDLANGAAGLLEEVQANKVTGEEEAFSHIDLVDFAGNVEGAQQAFEALKPGLTEIDADLTQTITDRFADVRALLETYKDPSALGGYKLYTAEVKKTDGQKLADSVQALQDSLSRLAEKVATA
ncbi:iron uptake system protein EfeO [Nocardioides sp.]|uniref:iron uptake system protein EfeO n=1 Tax=Nocardioides sp. TaxID=35761 RepID=UPI0039E50BFD